jgi:hypothetical protein
METNNNKKERLNMFVLVVLHDSTDPWTYGPYKTINQAQKAKKDYQRTWTHRDWDAMTVEICELKKRG